MSLNPRIDNLGGHFILSHKKTKQARSACLVYYNKILVELHTTVNDQGLTSDIVGICSG